MQSHWYQHIEKQNIGENWEAGVFTLASVTNISLLHLNKRTQYLWTFYCPWCRQALKNLGSSTEVSGIWRISLYVFVNEWSPWFASLHSHPRLVIAAESCASALHINTFRTESQVVFYIFKVKKNNRAFFHGPLLQELWVMCPFSLNYCL